MLLPWADDGSALPRRPDRAGRRVVQTGARVLQPEPRDEYSHDQTVADGVNVDFDVYQILIETPPLGSAAHQRHTAPRCFSWDAGA